MVTATEVAWEFQGYFCCNNVFEESVGLDLE